MSLIIFLSIKESWFSNFMVIMIFKQVLGIFWLHPFDCSTKILHFFIPWLNSNHLVGVGYFTV